MKAAAAALLLFLLHLHHSIAFDLLRPRQRHPQHGHAAGHVPGVRRRACHPGCERNGNCNRALGICECPVGYTGPNCLQPMWPSCRLEPATPANPQPEAYCTADWHPKSCACLEQCAAFVCPDGTPESCERDFNLYNSKCFIRTKHADASNATDTADTVQWDGGSDFPEEIEEGVSYYKGWLIEEAKSNITRQDMVDVGIVEDVDPVNPLVVLPLSSCPLKCSMRGGCVKHKDDDTVPFCICHYGYTGEFCEQRSERTAQQNICWNNCQGRGTCRRGFCHCKPGWWGKDCSSSQVFAPHSARRAVNKLRVYVYDLPWTVSYQPEYYLGFQDHDQNYLAWQIFGEMFMNDTVVRTENPWEANLFYIPAMTYAFSENTGNSVRHSRRAVDYVRQHWPFFNRSQGLDHFLWLTGDRGACDWPAEEDPALANIIKVVHFGWHHMGAKEPPGWEGQIKNKHWGCFNPLRDISAAAYFQGQAETARKTFLNQSFDLEHVPKDRLLFFSGGIRPDNPAYSHGVRQQLWHMFGNGSNPQVLIHSGGMHPDVYARMLNTSKFCLAPSGYGWGIRLNFYMASGCVPVIVQDDVYQPYEDQLPYHEFSIRLPKASIPDIVPLLSEVTDTEYLQLRAGLAKHWHAFVWDKAVGGTAYDYMIRSLRDRMLRLQARHYHPVHSRARHPAAVPADPAMAGAAADTRLSPLADSAEAVPAS